jgi:glutamine synthetase
VFDTLPSGSDAGATGPAAPPGAEEVAALQARGVRYAAVSFVDLHGKIKAKMVPLDHLGQAVRGSELFTGAALDGVPQEVNDEEVSAHPDLAAGMVMPWRPDVVWYPSDRWGRRRSRPAAARSSSG